MFFGYFNIDKVGGGERGGRASSIKCLTLVDFSAQLFKFMDRPCKNLQLSVMVYNIFIYFLFAYSLQAICYVIFLLVLSSSLIHSSIIVDPTHYKGAADFLRGFCEIVTLLMTVFYICEEINQMRK